MNYYWRLVFEITNLLSLWEKFVDHTIEYHLANTFHWHKVLWPNLGGIQNAAQSQPSTSAIIKKHALKFEFMLIFFFNNLNCKSPLRICSINNGFLKVLPMEVYANITTQRSNSSRIQKNLPGSWPAILSASSHMRLCTPSSGSQWNLTKTRPPATFSKVNVLTPKPCIIRKLRGTARSDIIQNSIWVVCVCRPEKSQKLLC